LFALQAADASARRHEQLVGENERLERDYQRFTRRKNLQERIQVGAACCPKQRSACRLVLG
jgi:hypothetical protein